MIQGLTACLSVVSTVMLGVLIIFLLKFKASLPDVEQILVDVGESISEQLTGIFKEPQVKRAMSVLGKQSGDVRASKALKNKVASKALGGNVLMKKALEYLDITPLEGMELLNDPTFGPVIQNMLAGFAKGGQGLSSGFNNPGGGGGRQVPNMS